MNWKLTAFTLGLLLVMCKSLVYAYDCEDRMVTFVNPIRDRSLWVDNSLMPLREQKKILSKYNFRATWLLSYDSLDDQGVVEEIQTYKDDEYGIFLEVSQQLAKNSRTGYRIDKPWYFSNNIFLSAYSQNERKRIINKLFGSFKKKFGYNPKTVGAWWIDGFSLEYMKNKYGIENVMIVSDQKTTDGYGVWGQWWGWPYRANTRNVLVPSKDQGQITVIQWAQRHPNLAFYGQGKEVSNYSLQANDYTSLGLSEDYFVNTANYYLDCDNSFGQITIGMETGMEGYKYINEYDEQLKQISDMKINDMTINEFGNWLKDRWTSIDEIRFGEDGKKWTLTKNQRTNEYLGENLVYPDYVFSDYFVADTGDILTRDLSKIETKKSSKYIPVHWLILTLFIGLGLLVRIDIRKIIRVSLCTVIVNLLIFKGFEKYGWAIGFVDIYQNMMLVQAIVMMIGLWIFIKIEKYLDIYSVMFFYGLVGLGNLIRYTVSDGSRYIGILVNKYQFIGIGIGNKNIRLINKDFGFLADSLIKVDIESILSKWDVYILTAGIAILFGYISKKIKIFKNINYKIMCVLMAVVYILVILNFEPSYVL